MSPLDLKVGEVYEDGNGRYRLITEFSIDKNGKRQVTYEKGFFISTKSWHRFESCKCYKRTFAKWAKRIYDSDRGGK